MTPVDVVAPATRSPDGPAAVVGYRRTNRGGPNGQEAQQDLDRQTAVLRAAAATFGATLPPALIFEDHASGLAGVDARPGLQALLAYCRAHPQPTVRPGAVLVTDHDRLGRFADPRDRIALEHEFGQFAWRVRVGPHLVAWDAAGFTELQESIHALLAAIEGRRMRAHIRAGVRAAAARGSWLWAAPFGYRRVLDPERGAGTTASSVRRLPPGTRITLALGPEEEVAAIRWLFDACAEGVDLGRLAASLHARVAGRRFTIDGVRRYLTNPAYVGDVVWGRTLAPDRLGGDLVVATDAHPAIVSRAVFAAVADRLRHTGRRHARRVYGADGG